jgi:hypothetical protein
MITYCSRHCEKSERVGRCVYSTRCLSLESLRADGVFEMKGLQLKIQTEAPVSPQYCSIEGCGNSHIDPASMRHCLVVGTLLLAIATQLIPVGAFTASSSSQKTCVRKLQPQAQFAAAIAAEQGQVAAVAVYPAVEAAQQQAAMPRTGYEVVQSYEVPETPPALSDAVKRGETAEFPMPIAMWLHGACTEQFPSISAARKAVRRLEIVLNGKDATTMDRVKPGIVQLRSCA